MFFKYFIGHVMFKLSACNPKALAMAQAEMTNR